MTKITSGRISPSSQRPLPDSIAAPGSDDAWLRGIVPQVEAAIDSLVHGYRENPFLHRVEHSLHVELFREMAKIPGLDDTYALGDTGYRTRLIHKEWPETTPRLSKARPDGRPGRRGNFDLVVLAPSQLTQVTSIEQFTRGVIEAPIAIELGLGYGNKHLQEDIGKLTSSGVPFPYLVHFSHVASRMHSETEELVTKVQAPLQIAYVRHDIETGDVGTKGLNDDVITRGPRIHPQS